MNQSRHFRTLFFLSLIVITTIAIVAFLLLQLVPLAQEITGDVNLTAITTDNSQIVSQTASANVLEPTAIFTTPIVMATVDEALFSRSITTANIDVDPTVTISIAMGTPTFTDDSNTTAKSTDSTSRQRATITGNLVNVRSAPSVAGEILAQIQAGELIEILETSSDGQWYKICCPLGTSITREAWVSIGLVSMLETAPTPVVDIQSAALPALRSMTKEPSAPENSQQGVVTVAAVNLREGPGTNYTIIGQVVENTTVTVIGRSLQNDWLQLCCMTNGLDVGWISAEFVEIRTDGPQIEYAELLAALPVPPTPIPPPPTPIPPTSTAVPPSLESDGNNAPQNDSSTNSVDPEANLGRDLPGSGNFGAPSAQNPLTGLPLISERSGQRPIIVCINNDPAARPQLGLSQADVVYEYLMEGYGITRFSAIFYGDEVASIGPVRSARLINYYMGSLYDAGLICSGASDQVRYSLKHEAPFPYLDIDLDDPSNSRYSVSIGSDYRTRLRTNTQGAHQWLRDWGVERPPSLRGFTFGGGVGGEPATSIEIPYPRGTGSQVSYRYDGASGQYLRWLGGAVHSDGNTGQQLGFDNVIIQYVSHEPTSIVEDSLGSTSIRLNLYGSGQALLFRDGVSVRATWRSDSQGETPRFYLDNGQEVTLKAGRTWVSIVPEPYTISYQ